MTKIRTETYYLQLLERVVAHWEPRRAGYQNLLQFECCHTSCDLSLEGVDWFEHAADCPYIEAKEIVEKWNAQKS